MLIELDTVDRITADALGTPGSRVFYIQARKGDRIVTLLVEKQQVQLLAAGVVEILSRVGKETGQGPPEEQMGLDEPVLPEWRAGRLSIGYHEERDLLVLEAEELVEGEEEDESSAPSATGLEALGPELDVTGLENLEEELQEDLEVLRAAEAEINEASETADGTKDDQDRGRVRFWASREQMLSLARHGALVCASGRPTCPLCRNPMDEEGHRCPAMNGHRELGQA